MLTRLTHAAIAFAVTAVLYQGYVLAVVPFVEPAASAAPAGAAEVEEAFELPADGGAAIVEKFHPLLSTYFPADHWSLARPPIVLESDQAIVVFDDKYERSDKGVVKVPRCAVIYFPRPRNRAAAPPRDAIVLEPSGGATLQMDQPVGAASGFGRLQFGELAGDVVIRSDMRDPGPADDLRITTSKLYMNESMIRTDAAVEMRLGDNFFRGRSLEIRFLPAESSRDDAAGKFYGNLESLEISSEVNVAASPKSFGLFGANTPPSQGGAGGGTALADSRAATPLTQPLPPGERSQNARAKALEAPVRIRCTGPFRIDFGNYLASFSENVEVRQLHPDGNLDQLRATELNLFFVPTRGRDVAVATPASEPGSALTSIPLEPATIEAKGTADAPVALDAPSQESKARCERLRIELRARSVTLEGGDSVSLSFRDAELHARTVWYQLPPPDSNAKVGEIRASGAGWLRAALNPSNPNEVFTADWKEKLALIRVSGQPVLTLYGRPKLSLAGVRTLYADQIDLFLKERRPEEVDASQAVKIAALPAAVVPQRLSASGRVSMESAELSGKVNQLDVKFNYPTTAATAAPANPAADGGTATPAPASQFDATANLLGDRSGMAPVHTYEVSGVTLTVSCNVRDKKAAVASIRMDGGVVFEERLPVLTAEPPLRITGEHLKITKADTPNAEIEVLGAEAGADGLPAVLAEITARGTTLRTPSLVVHRGTEQAWINSPGEITLMVNRDMSGQPLATPQPVAVNWGKALEVDHNRITFRGDVFVQHSAGWLRTDRLVAQLTRSVLFGGSGGGEKGPELEQVECWEGAVAEFDQRDLTGVTSHQHLEVASLAVNQLNGNISGEGPGVIDSVHYSNASAGLLGGSGAPAASMSAGAPALRRLHIDFSRAVSGNLLQKDVAVAGDVHTVYGPVDSWDQPLSMSPGGSPPPDTFWLTCDQLRVVESPLGQINPAPIGAPKRGLGPVELSAIGRVVIEGQNPAKGAFTLRGGTATYDQSKALFVLAGEGPSLATVTHQQYPGATPSESAAHKLMYQQTTGKIGDFKGEGVDKLQIDWSQFQGATKPKPAPAEQRR